VAAFKQHGCPLLIGHSRKSFLGRLLGLEVTERDPATAVVSAILEQQGVDMVRVHDVRATRQIITLLQSLWPNQGIFSGKPEKIPENLS
jgi:dihydropteroate synthase